MAEPVAPAESSMVEFCYRMSHRVPGTGWLVPWRPVLEP